MLIGDPKQAIYSFRGADVYAYLAAAQSATQKATLDTNWRSDQKLIDAYDALFADVQLGHPGITYHPVHAAQGNIRTGLVNAPSCLPLRIRILDRRKVGLTNRGCAKAPEAQRRIARDLASDVTSLLSSEASVSASRGNTDGELVPIGPGDIAVLVRTNRQAGCVRDALDESGVPLSSPVAEASSSRPRRRTGFAFSRRSTSPLRGGSHLPRPSLTSWDGTPLGSHPPATTIGRSCIGGWLGGPRFCVGGESPRCSSTSRLRASPRGSSACPQASV